ncbi:MAG: hypothetical protein NTW97_00025 [Candidatus Krumholzibacteria bacterium]|nr:hypothetical protein [Candidatus Krumholzibacteria bacterium]
MDLKPATIEEVLATFSSHLAKNYPSPDDFRRNFDLLLKGKRERPGAAEYPVSLERNIVFLNDLVSEAEAFVERILGAGTGGGTREEDILPALDAIEKKAHEANARRHREAFVEGSAADFRELREDCETGGKPYLDKLEFNYRYLMTFRIFLFEFISVLAAIRASYFVAGETPGILAKIRDHLEVTVHYYLGNVAVGGEEGAEPGAGGAEPGPGRAGGTA